MNLNENTETNRVLSLPLWLFAGRFVSTSQLLPRLGSPSHKGDSTTQRTRYDQSCRRNLRRSVSRWSWLDTRLRTSTPDLQIHSPTGSTTSLCIHAAHDNNGESPSNFISLVNQAKSIRELNHRRLFVLRAAQSRRNMIAIRTEIMSHLSKRRDWNVSIKGFEIWWQRAAAEELATTSIKRRFPLERSEIDW